MSGLFIATARELLALSALPVLTWRPCLLTPTSEFLSFR